MRYTPRTVVHTTGSSRDAVSYYYYYYYSCCSLDRMTTFPRNGSPIRSLRGTRGRRSRVHNTCTRRPRRRSPAARTRGLFLYSRPVYKRHLSPPSTTTTATTTPVSRYRHRSPFTLNRTDTTRARPSSYGHSEINKRKILLLLFFTIFLLSSSITRLRRYIITIIIITITGKRQNKEKTSNKCLYSAVFRSGVIFRASFRRWDYADHSARTNPRQRVIARTNRDTIFSCRF